MSNIFDEVEEQMNRRWNRGGGIHTFARLFIAVVFILTIGGIIYSFINPGFFARIEGRYYGEMMREADRVYYEDR